MRFLGALLLLACQASNTADTKIGGDFSDDSEKVTTELTWHYAKYKFLRTGYKDVDAVVRLGFSADNVPRVLNLKDLHVDRRERAVEEINITKFILANTDSDVTFSIGGENEHTVNGVDYGGTYTGTIVLNDDGTVPNDVCCGKMTFVPATNTELTFIGRKQTSGSRAYDETWWREVTSVVEPVKLEGQTSDEGSGQKFYALDGSTVLLSRTSLPSRAGASYRYLMQAVTSIDDSGRHQPPVVHIKQVNNDGTIAAAECLSLLFDEKDKDTEGRFNFNYGVDDDSVDEVRGISELYHKDSDSDGIFLAVMVQFPKRSGSYTIGVLSAGTNASVPLVTEKDLDSKNSEWGITAADIVAAFGANSGCDPQGHNRACSDCITW